MNEPDILYPAIFVFSMLLIGLLLTMREFSRLRKTPQADDREPSAVKRARPEDSADQVARASGF